VLENTTISPSILFKNYLDALFPWLEVKKQKRLWPRPIASGFTLQYRGVNYIASVAKKIATFLNLDTSKYTGHSFRRTAATSAADSGISLINLKRLGGWRSDSVASSYVDNSLAASVTCAKNLAPLAAPGSKEKEKHDEEKNGQEESKEQVVFISKNDENPKKAKKTGQFTFNITVNNQ
jgi:hypothetical protein